MVASATPCDPTISHDFISNLFNNSTYNLLGWQPIYNIDATLDQGSPHFGVFGFSENNQFFHHLKRKKDGFDAKNATNRGVIWDFLL